MTLLELVVTMAIIFVLASVALPLVKMNATRGREIELRQQLRTMRQAIDEFHRDWNRAGPMLIGDFCKDNALTCKEVSSEFGYPVSLDVLLEVKLSGEKAVASGVDVRRYLRRVPIDPMTQSAEWGLRCYKDDPDASTWCGDDVFDVYTASDGTALDGTEYKSW
ncbi:MAG: type II secretion system protein [Nitrospirota bacterium]